MLGHQLDDKMLADIINEVDADGSGELEFEEFVQLAARFMVEEDAEVFLVLFFVSLKFIFRPFLQAMQQELKEAFRLYDKEGLYCRELMMCLSATRRFHCLFQEQ